MWTPPTSPPTGRCSLYLDLDALGIDASEDVGAVELKE